MPTATPLRFEGGRVDRSVGRPPRVTALWGTNYGYKWHHESDKIIANIESGWHYYICLSSPQAVAVAVGADNNGGKFLKACTDEDEPEKLLALPLQWEFTS